MSQLTILYLLDIMAIILYLNLIVISAW